MKTTKKKKHNTYIHPKIAVKTARKIMAQPSLAQHSSGEVAPACAEDDDAAIEAFVREQATTIFHPTGTCKMGPDSDPMAVVRKEAGNRKRKRKKEIERKIGKTTHNVY